MNDPRPIVVGVDGSPSSIAAAEYAAALAERRQAPLHLIHGYQQALYSWAITAMPWPEEASDEQVRAEIEVQLRDLVERLRREHPKLVAIEARQIHATAASVLIGQSQDAQATVVGSRGIGGFSELLLGSVSWQVASHAHGPVIVVRPPIADHAVRPGPEQPPSRPKPLGPVLVAYDGSPGAEAALDFAVTEALQRNVRLVVATVYTHAQDEAQQMVTDALKPFIAANPTLQGELLTIESEHTDFALMEESRKAALTVLGSRGRGGFAGLLLGSVSRTLVHHAYGPVAVIHPAETRKEQEK
jgi:nucleotide-binding universal stress UspA family protein